MRDTFHFISSLSLQDLVWENRFQITLAGKVVQSFPEKRIRETGKSCQIFSISSDIVISA